ncbi:arylesterase [Shewanella sp. OPT22]|nr:arylesterase [Shewanella sp. OPT22]
MPLKHKLLAVVLFTLTASPAFADTILILGDSLGASYGMDQNVGWVTKLQKQMPEHKIINASVSGETTAGGLRRLPALLETTKPDVVLIELGGNDGLRGFSPKKLKSNLTNLVKLSKAANAKVLVSEVMVPPNYGPRYSKSFIQVYKDLAKDSSITVIPFFMTEIAPHPELMQKDGIHPNEKAQDKIVEFVRPWLM